MPYLDVKMPEGRTRVELSAEPVTVGRTEENTLVLRDEWASRRHCVIEPHGAGWRVRDLGSRNGIKLNREKIDEVMLDDGDVVRVGHSELRFVDPDQQQLHKRRNTPDFSSGDGDESAEESSDVGVLGLMSRPAADVDLNAVAAESKTDYKQQLRRIIESAPDKPFEEFHISLIDSRGTVVHEAEGDRDTAREKRRKEKEAGDEGKEALRAFRMLLLAAFRARATDIHVEPKGEHTSVRLRVDGYMVSAVDLPQKIGKRIFGVVKILCHFDTSHKAEVQDGHFSAGVKDRRVDFRVSFTPSVRGQKLVIRVLDTANAPDRLHQLGLAPWMYERLRSSATKDAGMLLACGPTGSGKTTTLYSCLREMNFEQRNAVTIEDPVEYSLEGCTQIPIDHKQGHTFASILRSVLRQDPDVIFVGEVRDLETANVALQAAMTGHLVYTTVHSKDSIGAIFRLLDLGVERYLVANAMDLIVAQRLVRVLCEHCKKAVKPTSTQQMRMGSQVSGVSEIYVPVGCKRCLRTGYRGRCGVFEMLDFTNEMRDVVLNAPSIKRIREIASQGLFTTLQQFGFQLVAQGVTSIDEIERVASSES